MRRVKAEPSGRPVSRQRRRHQPARNLAGATASISQPTPSWPLVVPLLLDRAPIQSRRRSGVTPLAAAAFKGNDRIVEQLIAGGADPKIVRWHRQGGDHYAAARGFVDVVRRLLDAGVARMRVRQRFTALMWAAGHDEGVGRAPPSRWPACWRSLARRSMRGQPRPHRADDGGRAWRCRGGELLLARGADRALRDGRADRARPDS